MGRQGRRPRPAIVSSIKFGPTGCGLARGQDTCCRSTWAAVVASVAVLGAVPPGDVHRCVGNDGWVASIVSCSPTRVTRGFLLAAVLGTPTALTGITATVVPTLWAGSIMIATFVASVILASRVVVPESKYWIVSAATAAGMSAILVLIWTPMAVLAVHGERSPAVVTGVQVTHGRHNLYRYSLHRPDGTPISGELIEYADSYSVGDQVEVIVDRRGEVDPVDTSALDEKRPTEIAAVVCLILTVVLSVMTGAGYTWSFGLGYQPKH